MTKKTTFTSADIKSLESKLAQSNTAFLELAKANLDGILIVAQTNMVIYANDSATKLFGRTNSDLLGASLVTLLVEPVDLTSPQKTASEVALSHPDESTSICELFIFSTEWCHESCYVLRFRDITERKKTEDVLDYMENINFLSDSPNRLVFEKQMHEIIQQAQLNQEHMAVLHINLDNFNLVNDALGHETGDLLLNKIAILFKDSVRKKDTIARLDGAAFVIILNALRKPEYAGTAAKNILRILEEPFELNRKKVYTHASIGIAVYPLAGTSKVDLIEHAEVAMRSAKNNGKNQYQFYSQELNKINKHEALIAGGLRNALKTQQFFMVYQPIVDLKTGDYIAYEALLRWKHLTLGVLLPDEFLPAAEHANYMVPIGKWVMQQVCSDYKHLKRDKLLFVTINVTADELEDKKIAENILENIQKFDVDLNKIVLELTETSFIKNPEILLEKLKQLSKVDIRVAIDDYGTGYSSLSYLKRLPVSMLKIDKIFIDDMLNNLHDRIIVESTLKLAHDLGLKVIAEGVETKAQVDFLKQHDCDYVQGFYFAKPLELQEIKNVGK
jgi:diguanylate cyclase (GGDEF)-like protein